MIELNGIAVILSAISYFILGGLWFSPLVFGKLWDTAIGFTRPKNYKTQAIYYFMPLISCFVVSVTIALLIKNANIKSVEEAAAMGMLVGAGFGTSVSMVNAILPTMQKPILFGLITGIYHFTGITLASIIIYILDK